MFLGLDTTIFQQKLIFEHKSTFYRFILFPFRIIKLLAVPNEGNHSWKNSQHYKKAKLNTLIVFVEQFRQLWAFMLPRQKLLDFFLFLPVFVFLFVVV